MNKFYSYINSAIYNIRRNKAYAAFCIFGTALTFVFISIVLQMTNEIVNNKAPFVNADRVVHIGTSFKDGKGQGIGGLTTEDALLLLNNIKEYELCAYINNQFSNIFVNDKFTNSSVAFVNEDYWKINEFDFIAGRPFTEEEVISKTPVVVLRKNWVESHFKTEEILGQKIKFQHIIYTIIGVVDEYSSILSGDDQVWAPFTLNNFGSGNTFYDLYILPPKDIALDDFKDKIVSALKFYYKNKSIEIDIDSDDILTQQETRIKSFDNNKLSYGIPLILLVLLLIPAINIVVVSVANINNRAKEIALRRSMGATMVSSFIQIMIENLLLVTIGAIIGVVLSRPIADLISSYFLSDPIVGEMSLITNIDFMTLIFGVFPLALLFTLLSGGIPAYLIAKAKISNILKGDFNKPGNIIKRFLGIFIEQSLVFIVLICSIVSISIAIDKYNKPGLLDTDDVITFGYIATDMGGKDLEEVSRQKDALINNLRKNPNVKAITESCFFAPYLRPADDNISDSVTIDKTKLKVFIKGSDKYGMSVFAPELIEGDWFTDSNLPDGSWSLVITKEIADTLKWNKSVGKKFSYGGANFTVIGVLAGLKNDAFTQSAPTIIMPIEGFAFGYYKEISARVDDKDVFATDFFREWDKLITSKNVTPFFSDSDTMKRAYLSRRITHITLYTIPALFLLIFAFIGTFGIFWLTSQKRIKEFALRIAIGSTPKGLMCLVIKESIIITTLAMIPGLLLSIFIYEGEFTLVHFIAIGVTVILMFLFSIFSAWYPAYTVSKINPAKAIKYE